MNILIPEDKRLKYSLNMKASVRLQYLILIQIELLVLKNA